MKIWYVASYDQPKGQSTRTYDFSKELVRRGHEVTMFTNGYCHFTQKERLRDDELWRVEMVDGIRVVWLKTRPYVGNGMGRGLNMLDNVRRVLQSSRCWVIARTSSWGLRCRFLLGGPPRGWRTATACLSFSKCAMCGRTRLSTSAD